jgi:hypothetical protein
MNNKNQRPNQNSVIAGLTRNPLNTVKHLLTTCMGLRVKPAMTELSSAAMTELWLGLWFLLFILLLSSCEEELTSPIPNAPVNITLDLDFADSDLVPALAIKSITKPRVATDRIGFGGILIINGYSSNGATTLFAYDLACPVEVDRNILVVPDNIGKARCSQCGAVYNTAYGSGIPESGSKYPLRSYFVRKTTGGNRYIIVN